MPYRKARNSTDDHYAAPVTVYVNGCVLEACRIEASRLKWARSGAGRTESYVKAPSLATSGQVRHPGFGKDLPGHVGDVEAQGRNPITQHHTTSWAAAKKYQIRRRESVRMRILRPCRLLLNR